MKYDRQFFDAGIDRKCTNSVKWDLKEVVPDGAVPMWVADMDFAVAEPITDALTARAAHACYGYNLHGDEDTEAFCAYWQRRHGLSIKKEDAMMLPCVITGLRECVRTLTKEGEGVIIQTPVYGPFYDVVRQNGRTVLEAPLLQSSDGRYMMNLPAIEEHLKNNAKMMMLCSPHNPVSRLWSKQELEELVALLTRYDAYLVVDEIHADFVYAPARFTPILSVMGAKDISVMLASASKTFNIAGLQQSMLVTQNKEIYQTIHDDAEKIGITCGNTFALCATKAAYESCDDWLDGTVKYLDEARSILKNELEKKLPLAKLTPVDATYLAWVDMSGYNMNQDDLLQRCKEQGVIFNDGRIFGKASGENHLRVNFGCPHAQLREAISRLAKAVEG